MKILDRYIARQYIFNTVVLLFLLFAFVVTIDVALNLDRFVSTADRLEAAAGNKPSGMRLTLVTIFLIADLWWPRLLQLFNFLIGLVLTGSMGFTLTQLVRHRELVAVLASGVSLFRVARPVVIVVLGATLLQVLNQELVIPRLAESGLLTRDYRDSGRKEWGTFEVRMVPDSLGNIIYAQSFDNNSQTMKRVHIWQRDADGQAVRRISADRAVWNDPGAAEAGPNRPPAARKGFWILEGATQISLRPLPSGQASVSKSTASTPTTMRFETDLDPRLILIKRYASLSQSLSWAQIDSVLSSGVVDAATRDTLERVRWGRIALILSNLLAILINLPFFLTREPKNMAIQSLKCAPVGIITMMGGVLLTSMTIPGLPPQFAVFLPVLILTPIAIAVMSALKT